MTHDEAEQLLSEERVDATLPSPSETEEPPPPLRAARRRKLPIATLALALAAAGGVGFFAGVRVEKSHITPTASTGRTGAGTFSLGAAADASNRRSGTSNPAGTGAGGTNGGGVGSAANILGTVTVVQGGTVYVTEANGDTVKVTTSDGTTVTKTVPATVKDLTPGQSVVIRAVQSGDGVYAASSINPVTAGSFAGFGRGGRGTSTGAAGNG